jgi:ubiquinol-cytochrome c reductase cytochrome b subunit
MPILGGLIVQWIWGGFSVSGPTLSRFFALHFTIPFIILFLVVLHLRFLHETGSSSPLISETNFNKIPFQPFFIYRDLLGFILIIIVLLLMNLLYPFIIGDCENFIPANPLSTPTHIQPE